MDKSIEQEERLPPSSKDFEVQCRFLPEMTDKEVQVIRKALNKGIQTISEVTETKSDATEQKHRETQTTTSDDDRGHRTDIETQTDPTAVDNFEQEIEASLLTNQTKEVYKDKSKQVSPGRGFWRQQMDYITSTLKLGVIERIRVAKCRPK